VKTVGAKINSSNNLTAIFILSDVICLVIQGWLSFAKRESSLWKYALYRRGQYMTISQPAAAGRSVHTMPA
jgi:hypothetical protein